MPEIISKKDRKANKEHVCSYCGGVIQKGETYEHSVLKFCGEIYDWKAHQKCKYIAIELWDYIDPDDGMTDDDFRDGCRDFCLSFICPDCPRFIDGEFEEDECFCLDKVYELLQTHELVRESRKIGTHWLPYSFKLRERVKKEEQT
jgi:hypothetical protein